MLNECKHKIEPFEMPLFLLFIAAEAGVFQLPCCVCGEWLSMAEILIAIENKNNDY